MAVGTMGDVASSRDARVIEGGHMTLDRWHLKRFQRLSAMTPLAEIDLGDVVLVKELTEGIFKGGAVVMTVESTSPVNGKIAFNGWAPNDAEIRAIAAVNFRTESEQ